MLSMQRVRAMPTAETALSWATGVANEGRCSKIAWHVTIAALLIVLSRSRVSQRLLGVLLVLPVASVAVLAAMSSNPFNAVMFSPHGPPSALRHGPAPEPPLGWRGARG